METKKALLRIKRQLPAIGVKIISAGKNKLGKRGIIYFNRYGNY